MNTGPQTQLTAPPPASCVGKHRPWPSPPLLHASRPSVSVLFNNFRIKSHFSQSVGGWGRGLKIPTQVREWPPSPHGPAPGILAWSQCRLGCRSPCSWGVGEAAAVRGSAGQSWGSSSGHGLPQAPGSPASAETGEAARLQTWVWVSSRSPGETRLPEAEGITASQATPLECPQFQPRCPPPPKSWALGEPGANCVS